MEIWAEVLEWAKKNKKWIDCQQALLNERVLFKWKIEQILHWGNTRCKELCDFEKSEYANYAWLERSRLQKEDEIETELLSQLHDLIEKGLPSRMKIGNYSYKIF